MRIRQRGHGALAAWFLLLTFIPATHSLTFQFTPSDPYLLGNPFTFTWQRSSSDPAQFTVRMVMDNQIFPGPTITSGGATQGTIGAGDFSFPRVGNYFLRFQGLDSNGNVLGGIEITVRPSSTTTTPTPTPAATPQPSATAPSPTTQQPANTGDTGNTGADTGGASTKTVTAPGQTVTQIASSPSPSELQTGASSNTSTGPNPLVSNGNSSESAPVAGQSPSPSASVASDSDTNTSSGTKHNSNIGAIAGGIVAGLLILFILLGYFLCYRRRRRERRLSRRGEKLTDIEPFTMSGNMIEMVVSPNSATSFDPNRDGSPITSSMRVAAPGSVSMGDRISSVWGTSEGAGSSGSESGVRFGRERDAQAFSANGSEDREVTNTSSSGSGSGSGTRNNKETLRTGTDYILQSGPPMQPEKRSLPHQPEPASSSGQSETSSGYVTSTIQSQERDPSAWVPREEYEAEMDRLREEMRRMRQQPIQEELPPAYR